MRRVASRVWARRSVSAGRQSGAILTSRHCVRQASVITAARSLRITASPHSSQRRTLHSTAARSQAHEASTQPEPSSTPPQPTPQPTDHSTGPSPASSAPVPSYPPSVSAPLSVTAVATPLSRSAAAAPTSASSPSPLRLLRVPDLALGEARLSRWLVPPAAAFSADCALCELDTDLAVIEYKADRPGWLAVQAVREGDEVRADQPIAVACDREEQLARVRQDWMDRVARKERERELRAERPPHSLSDEVAKMKD